MTTALTVTASSAANTISTGAGNDTIDGGGGADAISAGGGNDTVSYYGTETSIDGGTGTNTLVLRAAVTVNLGNADETSGDAANVTNFQNVDASALSSAVTITGSSAANTITGGSGNDTIDGAGGADIINAGAGNDSVTYRGTETSIDGGAGSDTLMLAAGGGITAVNFAVSAGADQTTGDSVSVANFENLDASAIGSALTVTGSSAANTITTGSGNDTIDGGGGADIINAGAGDDTVSYRGTESSIDGGSGTNTLVMAAAATVNLANADQTTGDRRPSPTSRTSTPRRCRRRCRSPARPRPTSSPAAPAPTRSTAAAAPTSSPAAAATTASRITAPRRRSTAAPGTNTLVLRAAGTVNLGNGRPDHGDPPRSPISRTSTPRRCPRASRITGSRRPTRSPAAPATTRSTAAAAPTSSMPAAATTPSPIAAPRRRSTAALGSDTLVLAVAGGTTAVNFSVAAGADQTTGDSVTSPISKTSTPARSARR